MCGALVDKQFCRQPGCFLLIWISINMPNTVSDEIINQSLNLKRLGIDM